MMIDYTDRELLELAAKAAGIKGTLMTKGDGDLWLFRDDFYDPWNPLTNDGDAFRLMVKLNFLVCPGQVYSGVEGFAPEKNHGDPLAATRRAIVRAAAEIGRNIK